MVLLNNQEVKELLDLCMRLNDERGVDAFFDYAPHCDMISVRVYVDGWKENSDQDFKFDFYTKQNETGYPEASENRDKYTKLVGFLTGLLYARRIEKTEVNENV